MFDIAVLGTILAAMVIGAQRGFTRQGAMLGSIVLGVGLGLPGARLLAPFLHVVSPLDRVIAFGILYLLISLGVHLLAQGASKFLDRRGLTRWDRHLGALSGALAGFAVSLGVTLVTLTLLGNPGDECRQTPSGKIMGAALRTLHPAWPEQLGALLPRDLGPLQESDRPGPLRQGPL
jgi:membrane protein required for colicin V production